MTNDTQYAGIVAIVGRPNVGKSTLLNQIIGQKVSITSRKPQTTRHRVLGIHTEDNYQMVFVDTPGLHSEEKRAINRLMNRAASSSLDEVELVLFLVEGNRWEPDDDMVLQKIKKSGLPCVLVINKVDLLKEKEELLPHLQELATKHDFAAILPISASQTDHAQRVVDLVRERLKPCEFFFPEEYFTDRSTRFMVSEIIREKLIRNTGEELPYDVTVEIERFEFGDNGVCYINGLLLVERSGQKAIIIGKKGERLKTIGRDARKDIEYLIDNKVHLELWVKVKSGWADDERALRSLGYGSDY
ncbi:GTPase Era [Saccharobesus litoralis]|uniref:GTPase Era n=1 Tax=Saccharobesus litoralis TaxID=2172099 RepID=A0A2S0VS73_9ALTE|nr:GTPase Era [Saccharobesus litoralis]AWB67066.1 GTPase Era [Saccharobesus litoralis]